MPNPFRSLAARVTLLVFVATVASSMAVSWISLQSLDGFFRRKVDQRFPEIARRIIGELDQWYTLRAREIEVFAASSILVDSVPRLTKTGPRGRRARAEAEQYLRYVLEGFPHFERLLLAGPDGGTLLEIGGQAPVPEGLIGVLAPDSDATSISDAHTHGEGPIQIASAHVRDARGRSLGRLHAFIDIGRLAPLLVSRELGETARIFLVDGEQRHLDPSGDRDRGAVYTGPSFDVPDSETPMAIQYDDERGTLVVGTRSAFPRFGWTLVVEQPYEEAFAPVVASMTRAIALNFAIVLICGLGASRIAGSLVRPLGDLAEGARRISEGERDVVIDESHSSEEVQQLTRTFNEMSRSQASFAEELEESHQALELVNEQLVEKNAKLSEMNLVLEQLSITDGLTKLHNHRYFQEAMRKACQRSRHTGEPLCLLLVDIDFFKRWNDRLGHAAGDTILRRLADVLNRSVRDMDLLARYGGEEFAVLASATDLSGAIALAEKIREAVSAGELAGDLSDGDERVSVSVGVAEFQGDRRRFFAAADSALYRAKAEGRDCVMVADESEVAPSRDGAEA